MKPSSILAALAIVGVSSTASAQTMQWPTPAEIQTFLQNTQTAMAPCAAIEVSPGVTIPVPCLTNLPKPPIDAPDAALPLNGFAPLAVDLRNQGLVGPVKDQAQVGVCWSFAISTVLESSLRRQGRSEVLAPLHIIAANTWSDVWRNGGKEALTTEIAWPYVPRKACELGDTDDDCGRTYGVQAGGWRNNAALVAERQRASMMGIATAGKARALKGDTVGQITTALASGRAVYASVGIDSASWNYRGIQNGVLAPYGAETRGGHAVTLVGYRTLPTGRQFLVQNSWGKKWGEGGYVWITEPELRRHMRDAFIMDATLSGATPFVTQPVPQQQHVPTFTLPPVQRCPSGLPAVLGMCWLG